MTDLEQSVAEVDAELAELQRQHDALVAATEGANSDDEHDPEGATIAFERQQLVAVMEQLHTTRADLVRAVHKVADGSYGRCETCGGAIGAERLEARPAARTCIRCAR